MQTGEELIAAGLHRVHLKGLNHSPSHHHQRSTTTADADANKSLNERIDRPGDSSSQLERGENRFGQLVAKTAQSSNAVLTRSTEPVEEEKLAAAAAVDKE